LHYQDAPVILPPSSSCSSSSLSPEEEGEGSEAGKKEKDEKEEETRTKKQKKQREVKNSKTKEDVSAPPLSSSSSCSQALSLSSSFFFSFLFLSQQVKHLLSSSSSASSLPLSLPLEAKKKKKKREGQDPHQQRASRRTHSRKREEEEERGSKEEEEKEDLIDGELILKEFKEALESLTGVSLAACSPFYLSSSSLYDKLLELARRKTFSPQSSHEDHLPSSSSLPLENERKSKSLSNDVKKEKKENPHTKKEQEDEEETHSSSSSSPGAVFDRNLLRASFFSCLHDPPASLDGSALHHLLLLEVEVLLLLSPFLECKKKELTGQRRILHARLVAHNTRVLGGARGERKETRKDEQKEEEKTRKTEVSMDHAGEKEEEEEEDVEREREKLDGLLKAWNSSARAVRFFLPLVQKRLADLQSSLSLSLPCPRYPSLSSPSKRVPSSSSSIISPAYASQLPTPSLLHTSPPSFPLGCLSFSPSSSSSTEVHHRTSSQPHRQVPLNAIDKETSRRPLYPYPSSHLLQPHLSYQKEQVASSSSLPSNIQQKTSAISPFSTLPSYTPAVSTHATKRISSSSSALRQHQPSPHTQPFLLSQDLLPRRKEENDEKRVDRNKERRQQEEGEEEERSSNVYEERRGEDKMKRHLIDEEKWRERRKSHMYEWVLYLQKQQAQCAAQQEEISRLLSFAVSPRSSIVSSSSSSSRLTEREETKDKKQKEEEAEDLQQIEEEEKKRKGESFSSSRRVRGGSNSCSPSPLSRGRAVVDHLSIDDKQEKSKKKKKNRQETTSLLRVQQEDNEEEEEQKPTRRMRSLSIPTPISHSSSSSSAPYMWSGNERYFIHPPPPPPPSSSSSFPYNSLPPPHPCPSSSHLYTSASSQSGPSQPQSASSLLLLPHNRFGHSTLQQQLEPTQEHHCTPPTPNSNSDDPNSNSRLLLRLQQQQQLHYYPSRIHIPQQQPQQQQQHLLLPHPPPPHLHHHLHQQPQQEQQLQEEEEVYSSSPYGPQRQKEEEEEKQQHQYYIMQRQEHQQQQQEEEEDVKQLPQRPLCSIQPSRPSSSPPPLPSHRVVTDTPAEASQASFSPFANKGGARLHEEEAEEKSCFDRTKKTRGVEIEKEEREKTRGEEEIMIGRRGNKDRERTDTKGEEKEERKEKKVEEEEEEEYKHKQIGRRETERKEEEVGVKEEAAPTLLVQSQRTFHLSAAHAKGSYLHPSSHPPLVHLSHLPQREERNAQVGGEEKEKEGEEGATCSLYHPQSLKSLRSIYSERPSPLPLTSTENAPERKGAKEEAGREASAQLLKGIEREEEENEESVCNRSRLEKQKSCLSSHPAGLIVEERKRDNKTPPQQATEQPCLHAFGRGGETSKQFSQFGDTMSSDSSRVKKKEDEDTTTCFKEERRRREQEEIWRRPELRSLPTSSSIATSASSAAAASAMRASYVSTAMSTPFLSHPSTVDPQSSSVFASSISFTHRNPQSTGELQTLAPPMIATPLHSYRPLGRVLSRGEGEGGEICCSSSSMVTKGGEEERMRTQTTIVNSSCSSRGKINRPMSAAASRPGAYPIFPSRRERLPERCMNALEKETSSHNFSSSYYSLSNPVSSPLCTRGGKEIEEEEEGHDERDLYSTTLLPSNRGVKEDHIASSSCSSMALHSSLGLSPRGPYGMPPHPQVSIHPTMVDQQIFSYYQHVEHKQEKEDLEKPFSSSPSSQSAFHHPPLHKGGSIEQLYGMRATTPRYASSSSSLAISPIKTEEEFEEKLRAFKEKCNERKKGIATGGVKTGFVPVKKKTENTSVSGHPVVDHTRSLERFEEDHEDFSSFSRKREKEEVEAEEEEEEKKGIRIKMRMSLEERSKDMLRRQTSPPSMQTGVHDTPQKEGLLPHPHGPSSSLIAMTASPRGRGGVNTRVQRSAIL
ncbi:ww domain-containing protein, partial [Cystoisospora suis]